MLSLFPIYATFPLTPLENVEGINLICLKRVNAMDTARITLNLLPEDAKRYIAPGSPLMFRWSSNGVEDVFYGYVHSFRPETYAYQQRIVILAIGAGYPMFNEPGRTFYRVGIHNVVQEIAQGYRFQLDMDRHPLMQEQILQGDESDWALMVRLADEWGYVLLMDGVSLTFRRLDGLLEDTERLAEYDETESIVFRGKGSSLISFEPSFSAVSKSPVTQTKGSGINAVDANPFRWQTEIPAYGLFQETVTRAVQSELEGELVEYSGRMRSRFPFTAKALMQSPINKRPFDVYFINHEGRRQSWAIQSVKHIVSNTNYVGEMVLGSDGSTFKSNRGRDQKLDIPGLLRRRKQAKRAKPVILDARPYYVGAGASAIIGEQRWRAEVIRVDQGDEAA